MIAIVGGGIAGNYLAMRLGEKFGNKICLFDKDKRVGGRLAGVKTRPHDKNSPLIGVGGRRVLTDQAVMMKLAKELNITLEEPESEEQFCFARGKYEFTKDYFAKLYSGLPVNIYEDNYEDQLIRKLFDSPERENIINHPDLWSYIVSVIGVGGFNFLRDMSIFNGDFTYPLSAKSYIDWLQKELAYDWNTRYPIGGMSIFVKKMELKARRSGVRIFKRENIYSINKDNFIGYRLSSSKRTIEAEKVIIAVPAKDLVYITGDTAEAIRSQPQFKDILGIRVMTITQWYEKSWWKDVRMNPYSRRVWRAWTSDNCLVSFEIPQEPYLANENVFRASYNDDLNCVRHFALLKRTNQTKLEEEIRNGLKHLLRSNGITIPVHVPKATKTFVTDWQSGWYWLAAGSKFSNTDIKNWAARPLIGEKVGLASDAYYIERTGWSEAAISSSINLLETQYNLH